MRRYLDRHGTNAITHFERTRNGLKVRYSSGHEYHFTEESAGVAVVKRMTQLAESGKGLGSFILDNKPGHARRRKV